MACENGKKKIMNKKRKLGDEKIFTDDDLTKEERRIQKILRDKGYKERIMGKKVKIGDKKMWVDGKLMEWKGKIGEMGNFI